jgi:betaine lipid synthase
MTSLMLITSVNAHFHVQHLHIFVAASAVLFVVGFVFAATLWSFKNFSDFVDSARSYARFFYASFLKPHTGDHTGTQQDALESFYQAQVGQPSLVGGMALLTRRQGRRL